MPVELNDLDPLLLSLGKAAGLINPDGTLLPEWFLDPFSKIWGMPSNPAFLKLLEQILGSGNALGTTKQAGARTWLPISLPTGQSGELQPTGLYLVIEKPVGAAGTASPPLIGIGINRRISEGKTSITPSIYLPICQLPQDSQTFKWILTERPFELEIEIAAPFRGGGITFDGATIAATVAVKGSPRFGTTIILRNLSLPGNPPADWSLLDMIEHPKVNEWVKIVVALLGEHLKAAPTTAAMLDAALGLLGMTGDVPSIDWVSVLHPEQFPGRLAAWFRSLAQSPALMRTWLGDWSALFNPGLSPAQVTGSGTPTAPWKVGLLTIPGKARLELTLGVSTTSDGSSLLVLPGLTIVSEPTTPIQGVPAQATVEAEVQLLELTLPAGGSAATVLAFPTFAASVVLTHTNVPVPTPLLSISGNSGQHLTIGSVRFGFAIPSRGKHPLPTVQLQNVATEFGSWPLLDLTEFDLQAVETAIDSIVQKAIESFLGIPLGGGVPSNPNGAHLAAAIGVIPPPGAPALWPLRPEGMLLAASRLALIGSSPLTALAAYFARALARDPGDGPIWRYLLVDLAGLLGGTGTTLVNPAAQGQPEDPWQVVLWEFGTGSTAPAVYLDAWRPPDTTAELVLALEFGVPVPLPATGVAGTVTVVAELLRLRLPSGDGTGPIDAEWLPAASIRLRVRGAGASPSLLPPLELAGIKWEFKEGLLTAGWRRGQPFGLEGVASGGTLVAGSAAPLAVGDIRFGSSGTDWKNQLKQLAPVAVGTVGLFLLEHGGRFGAPLAAALGALPDLPRVVDGSGGAAYPFPLPVGISLPPGWPTFQLQHPGDPWLDLQQQLAALLASPAGMESLLRLVGWAVTAAVPPIPERTSAGSFDDPWLVVLPNVWNLQLLVWKNDTHIGLGLQRVMASDPADGVQFKTLLRIDPAGFPLTGVDAGSITATVTLTGQLSNATAGQPLVSDPQTGLTIQTAAFGVAVSFDGTSVTYAPVLNLTRTMGSPPVTLAPIAGTPQFTTPQGTPLTEALLNALASVLTASRQPALKAVRTVLELLSILQPSPNDPTGTPTGVRIAAWQALLANPRAFLTSRVLGLLSDPKTASAFSTAAATVLGVESIASTLGVPWNSLPPNRQAVGRVLAALGLLQSVADSYTLSPESWLGLLHQPTRFLSTRVAALFADRARVLQLITQLTQIAQHDPLASPSFSWNPAGAKVTLAVPDSQPVAIGDELSLSGHLMLDLRSSSLAVQVTVASAPLGVALVLDYLPLLQPDGSLSGSPVLSVAGWGPLPAPFDPLPIYPIPPDTDSYLARLGKELPLVALSGVLAQMVNAFVLPSGTNPTPGQHLPINVFDLFGLIPPPGAGKPPQVGPLLGIFLHPVEWLLNPQVLGDGTGGLDRKKLGTALHRIAGGGLSGPGTVQLQPDQDTGLALSATHSADGVQVGLKVTCHSNPTGVDLALDLSSTSDALKVQVQSGIRFGLGAGVQVNGAASLELELGAGTPSSNHLQVTAGYNQADAPGFTLTLSGKAANKTFQDIRLAPFSGLNQILGQVGSALSGILGDRLFAAYNDSKRRNSSSSLVKFVTDVLTATGVNDTSGLITVVSKWKADPLAPFEPSAAAATVAAVQKLLQETFLFPEFSADPKEAGLLTYSPTPEGSGSALTVKAGTRSIGGQPVFGLWVVPAIQASGLGLTTTADKGDTGIWVGLPLRTPPIVSFAVAATLDLDLGKLPVPALPAGPTLQFQINGTLPAASVSSLRIYPAGVGKADTTLVINLLPDTTLAWGSDPTRQAPDKDRWLHELTFQLLVPLLADVILSIPEVTGWLKAGIVTGMDSTSPGKILADWGLLTRSLSLNDLRTTFGNLSPEKIVTRFLGSLLGALQNQQVIPLGADGKGGISVVSNTLGYGLSLQLPDILLSASEGQPQIKLQLGKWMTSDADPSHNWIQQSDRDLSLTPGLTVYLIEGSGSDYQFAPKFDLVSLGLDFEGSDAQHPLVSVAGFELGAVRARVYLGYQKTLGNFGGAVYCDRIGLPLGPQFGTGTNANPVAQNLLSGGKTDPAGQARSVNPTFSASAGMVFGKRFVFQLYDAQENPTNELSIKVQQSFGPIQCRRIGIGLPPVQVEFDGSVSLAGLDIDLQGLTIGVPLETPTRFDTYKLALRGLGINYQGGPVAISGGFLEVGVPNTPDYGYYGEALIKAAGFEVDGLGGYTVVEEQASLFIYAALDAPLGGPPFFFVTGIAAGFGYNRGLRLPTQDQVPSFPLVAWVRKTTPPPASDNLKGVLGALGDAVPPQRGEYWIAAGIQWNSFDLLDGFALLSVSFGTDVEIALLGVLSLAIPKEVPLGYAELGLMVTFKETKGELAATAVLDPRSYVLDPDCHLTGGFAFYCWFKNGQASQTGQPGPSAGDFVITLGGYHPDFVPPWYYPSEPRLGFNWQLSDVLSIQGGLYFALTPSAVMAGGELRAVFQAGPLKAWFDAYADFLIEWKPFHFDIQIGIDIGVSFRVDILFVHQTFTVELGASAHIWGPPIGGSVHVSWWVVSFTIDFGASRNTPVPPLTWDEFDKAFLPQPTASPRGAVAAMSAVETAPRSGSGQDSEVVKIRPAGGLFQTVQLQGQEVWVINPHDLELVVDTAIPASSVTFNGQPIKPEEAVFEHRFTPASGLGVRPMRQKGLVSPLTVTIEKESGATEVKEDQFTPTVIPKSVPVALWSDLPAPQSGFDSDQVILNAQGGVRLTSLLQDATALPHVGPFPKALLDFDPGSAHFDWGNLQPPRSPTYPTGLPGISRLMSSVMDRGVADVRRQTLAALVANGVLVDTAVDLSVLAATADQLFLAVPLLVQTGGSPDLLPATPGA